MFFQSNPSIDEFDNYVTAEIPDFNIHPRLHASITSKMIHVCGEHCLDNDFGVCSKSFPKPFANETHAVEGEKGVRYRRRAPDDGGNIFINRNSTFTNQHVVSTNPYLILRYNCHLNVEFVLSRSAIKYLFFYFYKVPDRVSFKSSIGDPNDLDPANRNEIEMFQTARYLTANLEILYRFKNEIRFYNGRQFPKLGVDNEDISRLR